MMETFLCFESGGAFFLLPLDRVRHIVPGDKESGKSVVFMGREAEVFDPGALSEETKSREFAVLLEAEGAPAGLAADSVAGVFTLSADRIYPLPEEAVGEANDFLMKAAYLDSCSRWAFVIDVERFLNKERN